MFEQVELLTLTGGIGVLVFVFWNKVILPLLPNHVLLLIAYSCFLLAWFFTVLEAFVLPELSNLAEHALYAVGSILLCKWCYLSLSSIGNNCD
ncbi:hypothetical protein [Maridesulfovibrio zosterae]|uniref:hypothetical protein n=1 Tax=Maridesulfovibrio zosterae TaxID=82171 RepID=UPI00048984DB|nr:hypothetical protein [Maridesulfovibrio zosterae]